MPRQPVLYVAVCLLVSASGCGPSGVRLDKPEKQILGLWKSDTHTLTFKVGGRVLLTAADSTHEGTFELEPNETVKFAFETEPQQFAIMSGEYRYAFTGGDTLKLTPLHDIASLPFAASTVWKRGD